MSMRLTDVDHQILTILQLECARSQGYIKDRAGRSRQQVHTRLQILSGNGFLRAIHYPTAIYELITDPRAATNNFDSVVLNILNADGDPIGHEWIEPSPHGVPSDHQYELKDPE